MGLTLSSLGSGNSSAPPTRFCVSFHLHMQINLPFPPICLSGQWDKEDEGDAAPSAFERETASVSSEMLRDFPNRPPLLQRFAIPTRLVAIGISLFLELIHYSDLWIPRCLPFIRFWILFGFHLSLACFCGLIYAPSSLYALELELERSCDC